MTWGLRLGPDAEPGLGLGRVGQDYGDDAVETVGEKRARPDGPLLPSARVRGHVGVSKLDPHQRKAS